MALRDRLRALATWRPLVGAHFQPKAPSAPRVAPAAPVHLDLEEVGRALVTSSTSSALGPGASGPGVNPNPTAAPPMHGGRQSQPVNFNPFGLSTYAFAWRKEYQDIDLSDIDVGDYEAGQLLTILADLSPDVGKAVWNMLRMCGTDLSFQVVKPSDGMDDKVGQKLADAIAARLNPKSGGIDTLLVQLISSAYAQGAIALDVAPTDALDDVEDFFPVNPNTIFYVRDEQQNPVPFQRQYTWGQGTSPFRRMNENLFFYTPIDPWVDDMYGRSPIAPILQIIFFQIQVMRDLQRVIHAQGWPKIDLKLVSDILLQHMPAQYKLDPEKAARWVKDRMGEVISAYNGMAPEDAFIHLDYVEVNSGNVASGTRLFDVATLFSVIRGQVIAAVKQLPVVMGEHTGSTETYSTIELTIFAHSLESVRKPIGTMMARAIELGLRLQGYAAKVNAVWAPAQIYDRMTMAMADAQEMANEVYKRDQGFITQDQASLAITGSKAVGPAPPLMPPGGAFSGPHPPTQQPANAPKTPNQGKPGSLQPQKDEHDE